MSQPPRDADVQRLYEASRAAVTRCVRSIVRDEHDAEDLTQQVFLKVVTALPRDRPVAPRAWVLQIARNAALDHVARRRSVPVADPEPARAVPGPAEGLLLRSALAALPADQCRVVVLRHLVGLSPGEIAAAEGRTVASVHGLHHRGRRALREGLAT